MGSRMAMELRISCFLYFLNILFLRFPPAAANLADNQDEVKAGESAYAQLRLEEQTVLRKGDHFVLRFYSPVETIGGGVVLDACPKKHRKNDKKAYQTFVIKENGTEEEKIELICDAIRGIRNIRAEMNIPPSKKSKLYAVGAVADMFKECEAFFMKLASASEVVVINEKPEENTVSVIIPGCEMLLPVDELVDKEKEMARLQKEKETLEAEIRRSEGKLSNQGFLAKAPQKLIDEEKAKYEKYKEMLQKVLESMK